MEQGWGKVQHYLNELVAAKAVKDITTQELTMFHGMEDLLSLLRVLQYYKEDRFEVMSIDCAPTGEWLALPSVEGHEVHPHWLKAAVDCFIPHSPQLSGQCAEAFTRRLAFLRQHLAEQLNVRSSFSISVHRPLTWWHQEIPARYCVGISESHSLSTCEHPENEDGSGVPASPHFRRSRDLAVGAQDCHFHKVGNGYDLALGALEPKGSAVVSPCFHFNSGVVFGTHWV